MTQPELPTPPAPQAPPQQPPAPAAGAPSESPRGARGAIVWATAAIGGALVLVLGVSAVLAVLGAGSWTGSGGQTQFERRAGVSGITALELDIDAAEVALAFGPVTEATLQVTARAPERWRLSREGETLRVAGPEQFLGGSCVLGFCPPNRGDNARATLTLPEALADRALDVDVTVGAGVFTADGTFGEVSGSVGAGEMRLTGAATELDLTVELGRFDGDVTGVRSAALEVGVGELTARLRGAAPAEVSVAVELGSATLWLPDAEYRVDSRVDLGDLDNRLRTVPEADHAITALVDLGELHLRVLDAP